MSDVHRGIPPRRSPLEQVQRRVRSSQQPRRFLRVAALGAVSIATAWGVSACASAQANTTVVHLRPPKLVISLTFDDGYLDQYLYLRPLLRARHMNATYYVITSDSDGPFRCCMSFAQLRTLQSEGDDIGGHGVSHVRLTDPAVSYTDKLADVCGSRTDLLAHGIVDPVSYAYPFGAFNTAAEAIVGSCGYLNSREGGDASRVNHGPELPLGGYAAAQGPVRLAYRRCRRTEGEKPR